MEARTITASALILACYGPVTLEAAHLPVDLAPMAGVENAFEPVLPIEDSRPAVLEGRLDIRPTDGSDDWVVEVQPWDVSRDHRVLMGIAVPHEAPVVDGHRLELQRGAIGEAFESYTDGLEQELTLNWTPTGDAQLAPYSWRFIVRGGTVHVAPDGLSARIDQVARKGGAVVDLLGATDAEGRELPVRLDALPPFGPLSIVVDDSDAVAPTRVRLRWRSRNVVLEPESRLTAYGRSVSSAGDVDGDGFTDLAVSARRWNEPAGATGRVFVHRGGPSGIERSPAWVLSGAAAGAEFGAAVASAGDVDGDGFDDLLVGEPGLNQVHLVLGSADGLESEPTWTFQGGADTDAGWSLAGAGDVNDDGHADVLVGEPRADGPGGLDSGRVLLFLGGPAGLSDDPDQSFEGTQSFAHFGRCVASAGDVNGDGRSDVLLGAPLHDSVFDDDGRVVLHLGTADGLAGVAAVELFGEVVGGRFGESLAGLGDVDGDGVGDVAIGAPRASAALLQEAGQVQVLAGPDLARVETLWGLPGAHFGQSVSAAGDVNGDGLADLAVGAPLQDDGHGSLSLFLGEADGIGREPALMRTGALANSEFGMSVAGLGAADADGFSDVAVGAWYHEGPLGWAQGRVLVVPGHGLLTPALVAPVEPRVEHPATVREGDLTAGDLNLDGYTDIVVGSWGSGTDDGLVSVFLGSPTGLPQRVAREIPQVGARSGLSVAIVSDAEGDGVPDLVVGSIAGSGRIDLYRGSETIAVEADPAWTFFLEDDDRDCAREVVSAGDLDGDGFGDFATECNNRVHVFHGGADGPREAGLRVGTSVVGVGDVNGDGFSDLMIGRDVYLGSLAGLSEAPDFGVSAGSDFRPAGDVNGDGFADVLVRAGRVHVAYGSLDGLTIPAALDFVGNPFTLPTAVGDFDGDGSDDLVSHVGLGLGAYELNLYRGGDATISIDAARTWLGLYPTAFTHGDVDGDGRPDIVGATYGGTGHRVLFVLRGGSGAVSRRLRVENEGAELKPFSHVPALTELDVRFEDLSPMERQDVRLEWQLAAAGQSWHEAALETGLWTDSGSASAVDHSFPMPLPEELTGAFRWRVRLRGRAPHPWVTPWQARPSLAHDTHQRVVENRAPACRFDVRQLEAGRLELTSTGDDLNGDPIAVSWTLSDCTGPVEILSEPDEPVLIVDLEGCVGSCTVGLEVSDPQGASASCEQVVDWSRLRVSAGPDVQLSCPYPSDTLRGSLDFGGDMDVRWEPTEGLDDPTLLQPRVHLPGIYTLTVTERGTGCVASDAVTVSGSGIIVDAGPDTAVSCRTGRATLRATVQSGLTNLSGLWSPAGQVADPSSPVTEAFEPGVYIYEVRDPWSACVAADTVVVGEPWEIEPSDLHARPGAAPLRVARETVDRLAMSWEDTGSEMWSVYRGTLISLWAAGAHDHAPAGVCRVTTPFTSADSPAEDSYYLVASDCGSQSSTGRDSMGNERGGPSVPCP